MLHDFTPGAYQFLQGGFPYSAGVIAQPGWAIQRVRFARPGRLRLSHCCAGPWRCR